MSGEYLGKSLLTELSTSTEIFGIYDKTITGELVDFPGLNPEYKSGVLYQITWFPSLGLSFSVWNKVL